LLCFDFGFIIRPPPASYFVLFVWCDSSDQHLCPRSPCAGLPPPHSAGQAGGGGSGGSVPPESVAVATLLS
jgi:hypothetical protein